MIREKGYTSFFGVSEKCTHNMTYYGGSMLNKHLNCGSFDL